MLDIAEKIRRKEVVFFLGAGISRNAPSNLPLSVEFNKIILQTLEGKINHKLPGSDFNKLANIRLESFFSQLNSLLKGDIYKLINAIRYAQPNSIHYFISALYKCGYTDTALTTNFDNLLEKAVEDKVTVFHHPDDYRNKNGKNSLLYKLHGSIDDDIEKMKASIQISLMHVSRPLQAEKMQVLKDVVKKNHIVFLGYSGLDDFDIYPVLLKSPSSFSYYWINHTVAGGPIVNTNVQRLAKGRNNFVLIDINTSDLVRSLASLLQLEIPEPETVQSINILERIKEAIQTSEICKAPNYIIGKLFSFLGENNKCLTYYDLALEHKELPDYYLLRDIGATHVRLKNFDKAIASFKKCLKHVSGTSVEAAHRLNIGYTYLQKYKMVKRDARYLQLAEDYLLGAMHVPKIDKADLSYSLNNLCLVKIEKKDYEAALKLLNESIRLKKQIGEIRALGRSLATKGQIFSLINKKREALYYFSEALKIQKQVQDKEGIATTLYCKADHFARYGNVLKSKQVLEQAILLLEA